MAYKVLIVDDQKMVRQMFETVLNGTSDYTIAGMAQTAEEAVRSCLEQKIDLVLLFWGSAKTVSMRQSRSSRSVPK